MIRVKVHDDIRRRSLWRHPQRDDLDLGPGLAPAAAAVGHLRPHLRHSRDFTPVVDGESPLYPNTSIDSNNPSTLDRHHCGPSAQTLTQHQGCGQRAREQSARPPRVMRIGLPPVTPSCYPADNPGLTLVETRTVTPCTGVGRQGGCAPHLLGLLVRVIVHARHAEGVLVKTFDPRSVGARQLVGAVRQRQLQLWTRRLLIIIDNLPFLGKHFDLH